jgi:hypothetical protein
MPENKSKHLFTVNLEGLNLSEDHLQRIGSAIQKTVMTELGGVDFNKKQGGLLSTFGPRTRGIWYIEKLNNLDLKE